MTSSPSRMDIARITFAVIAICSLLAGCFFVLAPFLLPLIWATAIVVATWPLMEGLQRRLRGSRALAVTVLTLVLLMLLVVPLTLAVTTIVDHVDDLTGISARIAYYVAQPPPSWLHSLPASERLVAVWSQVAALTPAQLEAKIAPHAARVVGWMVDEAGSLTLLVVQFLLTVGLCAVLYMTGETAASGVRRFAHRLAGEHGDNSVVIASQAVRAVALGVLVTAIVQSLLAGIGLMIAGVPFASLLAAVALMLCIAQIGVFPILIPAVIWVFWSGETGMGVFLAVWSLVVGLLDNFLRPWLIRRGADLPLLLILAGVIGGLLGFGIIGLFVGPVLLAVSYRLIEAWIKRGEAEEAAG